MENTTVSGKGAQKRSQALAIRCYKLRQEGYTLSQIADMAGIERDKVAGRITLGERLLSLESTDERSFNFINTNK